MKISFPIAPPAFGRPQATFDRPSRAFADFLGDTGAQFGATPDQASSFGANGMFGSALSDRGSTIAQPPASAPPAREPEPGLAPPQVGETGGGPLVNDQANPMAGADDETGATPGLVEAEAPMDGASSAGGGAAADAEPAAVPSGRSVLETDAAAPTPGPDLDAALPTRPTPEGATSTVLLLVGQDRAIDLFMTSAALDECERETLRRRIVEVMTEHGVGLGDLRLNGETLTPSDKGGIHGYRG